VAIVSVGYYSEAFVNMLALLGWNPGTKQEIFTLEELTHLFDLDRVHKGGARFDPERPAWFNQQYLRMRPDAELGTQLRARMKERGVDIAPEKAVEAAHLLKERATFPNDMLEGDYLFSTGSPLNGNVLVQEELKKKWKPREPPPRSSNSFPPFAGLSDFHPPRSSRRSMKC
jgi:glutamyl-tRNA synthetase